MTIFLGEIMAYTEENLEAIQQAIVDLATGARAVEVTIRNKRIRYGEADIDKLKALKSEIEASLEQRSRFFRVKTSSGL